jgi:P-type E1-E2 ATPase
MIRVIIPGRGIVEIEHLVFDVNGTLALDGTLISGVKAALEALQQHVSIHLITADTHGKQSSIDLQLGLTAHRMQPGREDEQKAAFVRQLDADRTAAVGQGANDAGMLQAAALGVCVISREGMATTTLLASDLVVPDILSALELFEKPLRLAATLRK